MTAAAQPVAAGSPDAMESARRAARRNTWILGLLGFLVVLLVFTKLIQPNYGPTGIQGLAVSAAALARRLGDGLLGELGIRLQVVRRPEQARLVGVARVELRDDLPTEDHDLARHRS